MARAVPVVSAGIAGLVDLFRSPAKLSTNNSVPTNSSPASLLIECCWAGILPSEKSQCFRWRSGRRCPVCQGGGVLFLSLKVSQKTEPTSLYWEAG